MAAKVGETRDDESPPTGEIENILRLPYVSYLRSLSSNWPTQEESRDITLKNQKIGLISSEDRYL